MVWGNPKHFLPTVNGGKKLNLELILETLLCLFFIELSLEKYIISYPELSLQIFF